MMYAAPNVRRFRGLSVMLAGCLLLVAAAVSAADKPRPNVLFVFTDDHAAHAMSCYGSKINTTPNLDRIAREGMRFTNCFVTNSLCGPARATILTGKYSHLNGFKKNGDVFDGSQMTFPKLLQKAGYETAVIGKWHLESDPTGFDYWHVLIGQGPYYNPPMIDNGRRVKHTGYTTDIITDLSLDWLQNKRDADKPFLLMYQHKAPHRDWQPGPKHLTLYDDETIPEPPTLFDDYEGRGTPAKVQEMTVAEHLTGRDLKLVPPNNLTEEQLKVWNAAYEPKNREFREANLQGDELVRWKYQRYIKDYLRCVASVDDNLGRVLDYLDESGLAENTIVIYASDQGFFLGDHGWYDKRFMYEECYRTPFLVRWPGTVKSGSVSEALVSNLDFAETILEAAGVEIPAEMQGRSLVPILESGRAPEDWRTSLYYHYYEFPAVHMVHRHYGVRTDRYKLMHFYTAGEWEMYDLERDPHELRSVHDNPQYAEVRQELTAEIKRLQEELKVPEDTEPVERGQRRSAPAVNRQQ